MSMVIGVFLSTFHHEYDVIVKNLNELQKYITIQSLQIDINESQSFAGSSNEQNLVPCDDSTFNFGKFKKYKEFPQTLCVKHDTYTVMKNHDKVEKKYMAIKITRCQST